MYVCYSIVDSLNCWPILNPLPVVLMHTLTEKLLGSANRKREHHLPYQAVRCTAVRHTQTFIQRLNQLQDISLLTKTSGSKCSAVVLS